MPMEKITLSLDVSSKKLRWDEAANLRREISQELDKALRDAEIGKWVDGCSGIDIMTICIQTDKSDTAILAIKSTLAEYQFFPPAEIHNGS